MRILLDTHIYIWWLTDNKSLSKQARILITNAIEVYISSASIWEAAIKIHLGKLVANINDLVAAINLCGFLELPIKAEHAAKISELPSYHKDPFDRILIAQALVEPLQLLTADQKLQEYSELVTLI